MLHYFWPVTADTCEIYASFGISILPIRKPQATQNTTDPPLTAFFLEFLKDSQDRMVATVKEAFWSVVPPSSKWDKGWTILKTLTRKWTFCK